MSNQGGGPPSNERVVYTETPRRDAMDAIGGSENIEKLNNLHPMTNRVTGGQPHLQHTRVTGIEGNAPAKDEITVPADATHPKPKTIPVKPGDTTQIRTDIEDGPKGTHTNLKYGDANVAFVDTKAKPLDYEREVKRNNEQLAYAAPQNWQAPQNAQNAQNASMFPAPIQDRVTYDRTNPKHQKNDALALGGVDKEWDTRFPPGSGSGAGTAARGGGTTGRGTGRGTGKGRKQ